MLTNLLEMTRFPTIETPESSFELWLGMKLVSIFRTSMFTSSSTKTKVIEDSCLLYLCLYHLYICVQCVSMCLFAVSSRNTLCCVLPPRRCLPALRSTRSQYATHPTRLRQTTRFSQLFGRVYSSNTAWIASSNGNFVDASWFINPMNVLMCTTMLSRSVYFSLTIFLIREPLFRAFFLPYRAESLCHKSSTFVSFATCWRMLTPTHCLMVATTFLFRVFHSDLLHPLVYLSYLSSHLGLLTIRRSSILIFQST